MIIDTLLIPVFLNVACASFDGAAFLAGREYPGYNEVIVCEERGPVSILTGPYPSWQSFALVGAAEVLVLTAVSYGLKRLHCRYWWSPQISVSFIHGYLGIANIYTRYKYVQYGKNHGLM